MHGEEKEGSLNGFFIFTITDRQGPSWLQVSRHDGSPCLGLLPVPEEFRAPVAFRPRGLPLVSSSPCRLVSPLASRPLEPLICRRARTVMPCSLSGWSFLVSDCSLSSPEPCRPLSNLRFPGSSTVLAPVLETHALAWVCCRWAMAVDRIHSDGWIGPVVGMQVVYWTF